MTELYFKLKLIGWAMIVSFIVLMVIYVLIRTIIDDRRTKKIKEYMESIGYEKYLINVASVGGYAEWGYKRVDANGNVSIISNRDLDKMTVRQIKRKYL